MSLSRVQQTELLNLIRAKTTVIALYSTNPGSADNGTEITGGAYARQSIAFTAPASAGDGTYIANNAVITFPTASGDWSAPVSHYAVRDSGNNDCLFYGPLQELGVDTTRTVRTGDKFQIASNTLIHKEFD